MTQRDSRTSRPHSSPASSLRSAPASARRQLLALLAICCGSALAPVAYSNGYGAADDAVRGLPAPGQALSQISGIEEIGSVRVIDPLSLSFQVNKSKRYLVRLAPACPQLTFARNIVLSHAAGTVHAGFDTIQADGEQCRISEIYRL